MADINTIDTVTAGKYKVRIGRGSDGWEAVVVGVKTRSASPMGGMFGSQTTTEKIEQAPSVEAPHKWVAIGFAIEAYQWDQSGDDSIMTDNQDAYMMVADSLSLNRDIDIDSILDDLEDD